MSSKETKVDYPIYPNISVRLIGEDGNAYAILAKVRRALRRGGVSNEQIEKFTEEATRDTYDVLLQTVMKYVEVE